MLIAAIQRLKNTLTHRYFGVQKAEGEALILIYQEGSIFVFLVYTALQATPLVTVSNFMSACLMLVVRGIRNHASLRLRTWASLGLICAITTVDTWSFGGLSSVFMVWYFVVPIPFLLILGGAAMAGSIVLIAALITSTAWLQSAGLLPAAPEPNVMPWLPVTTMLLMMVAILAIPMISYVVLQQILHRQKDRNLELQETQKSLIQQRQQQGDFVASISHELRTPMNAIMGFLQTMEVDRLAHARNREMFHAMSHSAQHLMTVINDLLDFSQIQTGNLRITPRVISLHAVLHDVTTMFEAPLRERGIPLALTKGEHLPDWIMGDADRITQIIINLLGNAAKFTREGQVELKASFLAPARVRIEVRDTGCGIAPEQLRTVFDRFSTLTEQTRREYGGTGLGLSISQHLVNLMGGEIGVLSQLNVGSNFWFELPVTVVKAPAQASDTLTRTTPAQLENVSILVVDDSLINRVVAKKMLKLDWPELNVLEASGASTALQFVQSGGISLVLMDVIMPEVDGIEATRRLLQIAPDTPVIGLTADVSDSVHEACLEAGMRAVLTKPYTRDSLVNAVINALQSTSEHAS